jgi:creatinine amidohydrolase
VAERLTERSILVQPLGAIEQHGPHLPLSTDSVIATAVAEAAVAEVGDELDVWLLPTLEYTKSNEHAWSAGTVWLSATTLLAVLDDLGRCIATTPAKRFVFLNGHGGNSALLNVANRELRLAHGLMTFLTHPGVPPDQGGTSPADELGMGVHGGTDETSIMLHLAPHLVNMALAERRVPEKLAVNSTCASAAASASAGCPTTSSRTATSATPHRPPQSWASNCSTARCVASVRPCARSQRSTSGSRCDACRPACRRRAVVGPPGSARARSARCTVPTASAGAHVSRSPTPTATVAISWSAGCATSVWPSRSTPSATWWERWRAATRRWPR